MTQRVVFCLLLLGFGCNSKHKSNDVTGGQPVLARPAPEGGSDAVAPADDGAAGTAAGANGSDGVASAPGGANGSDGVASAPGGANGSGTATGTAAAQPGPVTVTWLGTAGLYVTDGKTSFLIDPFVSRYGLARVLARLPLEPKMDLIDGVIRKLAVPAGTPVLVTHSHYDHALDAPYFVQRLGSKLYGSGSTVFVGIGAGLKAAQMHQVKAGETLALGDFSIRFQASCHGPQFAGLEVWTGDIEAPLAQPTGAYKYKVGDHFSLAVSHPRGSFFHQSSACTKPGMYDGVHADTLFLGVASRDSTLGLVDPALQAIGAKRIVPIHWDDFFEPLADGAQPGSNTDMDELRATLKAQRPAVEEKELAFFESITL